MIEWINWLALFKRGPGCKDTAEINARGVVHPLSLFRKHRWHEDDLMGSTCHMPNTELMCYFFVFLSKIFS